MAASVDVRCSVLVIHKHTVLLVHRTHDGLDDWVLPGGTPRDRESLLACARRELLEETSVSASPAQIALVIESGPPKYPRHVLDVVFLATDPVMGHEQRREHGMQPSFVAPEQLAGLALHPPISGQLIRMLDPGRHQNAAYIGNFA